jgi:GNAT superfamily N-acetyltransferase
MDQLTDRNSTSYPKQLASVLESIKKDKDDVLKYHQRLAYEFVVNNPKTRGLQFYMKMGSGKTIAAASIAEGLKDQDVKRKIIVMSAKSLHANFRKDLIKYRKMVAEKGKNGESILMSEEALNKYIDETYQFISLNASNMITQVHKAIKKDADLSAFDDNVITEEEAEEFAKLDRIGNLDDTILIIDEAHNLFNAITNGSKNAMGLYKLIMEAKNIKLLFLTGTPIVNDPFEFAICMNMIAGPMGRHSNGAPITLFGEDYADFTKYFVGAIGIETPDPDDPSKKIKVAQPHIKNRDKFINRIIGLVSYYGADDKDQLARYPEQLETIVSKVSMSPKQYAAYISARDREIEETSRSAGFSKSGHKKPLQKPEGMSSSYRVRSRQFSNFLFPNYASRSYKDDRGYAKYEKFPDKLKEENLRVRGSDGKGDNEANFGLEIWSPKIMKLLEHVQAHMPFKFYSDKLVSKKTATKSSKKKVKGKGEMELKVRAVCDDDWKKIKAVHNESFSDKFAVSKDVIGYVAFNGNDVIGYVTVHPKTQMMKYLRVIPTYQRRGIGKVLLALALEKYPNAKLTIPKSDGVHVLDAYKAHGFYVVKETSTTWNMRRKIIGNGEMNIFQVKSSDDMDKVIALYVEIFGDIPSFNADSDVETYAAKLDDKIIGFAVVKPNHSSNSKQRNGVSYMLSLGVNSGKRRQGAGKHILNNVLTKYPKMYIKVDKTQHGDGSRKFYEESGFVVYRANQSHWYMRKIIGSAPVTKTKGGTGPGLVYSQFIDSGVGLVGKVLSAYGFKEIKNLDDALKHKKGASFSIISGDVDPELRAEIVRIFNSPENKKGEHLSLLLVTSTGAEGLDLKCVRHIHILEPYWHWSRLAQVFARGVRMDGHITLPEKDRNVQPYIYLSDYPGVDQLKEISAETEEGLEHIKKQMEKEDTTDNTLYSNSVQNQVLINSFLQAIKEASIDCNSHYKGKLECRLCAPTGAPLFVSDLDKDMKTRSPCEPLTEETVKAKSISVTTEIDGKKEEKEFAYVVAKDDDRRVHIFEFDAKLNAHSEIFEDHDFYEAVYAAIKKKEKKLF